MTQAPGPRPAQSLSSVQCQCWPPSSLTLLLSAADRYRGHQDTLSETVTFVIRLGQGKSRKNYVVSISNRFKRNLQDKRLLWTRPENIKSTFMCFDVV